MQEYHLFLFGSTGNQSQEKEFIFSLDGTRGGEGEPQKLKKGLIRQNA